MKKALIGLVVALALGGWAAAWAFRHHVIRTEPGLVVVPKKYWSWPDTWVDARNWTAAEFEQRAVVKRALIENGYAELVPVPAVEERDLRKSLDALAAETEKRWLEFKQSARAWWNTQLEAANAYLQECLAQK